LDAGTRKGVGSSIEKKRKHATKQPTQKLTAHLKKEAKEKAQLNKEHAIK